MSKLPRVSGGEVVVALTRVGFRVRIGWERDLSDFLEISGMNRRAWHAGLSIRLALLSLHQYAKASQGLAQKLSRR